MTNKHIVKHLIEDTPVVFAYATLLKRAIRNKVLKADIRTHRDVLNGWGREVDLKTKEGRDYDTLVPDRKKRVMGDWFLVTPKELMLLDKYEDEYRRKLVTLESGIRAFVYILKRSTIDPND